MHRANSTARFRLRIARSARRSSLSFIPLAFAHGLLPGAAMSDGPLQPGEVQGAGNWSPANSDGRYGGIMPVSYGLIQSRNTMSVRVGEFAGLDDTQKVAATLGLEATFPHGAATHIGSFETDLKGSDRRLHRVPKRWSAGNRPTSSSGSMTRSTARFIAQRHLTLAGARSRRDLDDDGVNGRRVDQGDAPRARVR